MTAADWQRERWGGEREGEKVAGSSWGLQSKPVLTFVAPVFVAAFCGAFRVSKQDKLPCSVSGFWCPSPAKLPSLQFVPSLSSDSFARCHPSGGKHTHLVPGDLEISFMKVS